MTVNLEHLRQRSDRGRDEPMWIPVTDWIVAIHARDPETGVVAEIPLRRAQHVTPGFYIRRYDETGCWLEPVSVTGETDG